LWQKYHVLAHFFLMCVLVPLVCMVHGTALIGADVDAQTITYLITRRMRRATVLFVKFIATALVLAVLCDLAMVALHLCTFAGREMPAIVTGPTSVPWNPMSDLQSYLLIFPAAVLGFLAVFTLIGLLTTRPLAISVLYFVMIELILSNLPVKARMYSLLHPLRVMVVGAIPGVADLYELPRELAKELYPQGATALPALLIIIATALAISAFLMTVRELTPTKISRE
jgi:hypothetical protein